MRALALVVSVAVVFAGCISAQETGSSTQRGDDAGSDTGADVAADDPRMTAAEKKADEPVAPCTTGTNGVTIPPRDQRIWCAKRTVTVTGEIALTSLPIRLDSTNGAITIKTGPAGTWTFVAKVQASAATAEAASKALDTGFAWSHVAGGRHALEAATTSDDTADVDASYEVTMPAAVAMDLELDATNGAIDVTGTVQDVVIDTTNGGVMASLIASASGTFTIGSTNGAVTLRLPEDAPHGYDLTAESTNGAITIGLTDGSKTGGGTDSATFRTNGYSSRAIRTVVALETTNGAITVQKA